MTREDIKTYSYRISQASKTDLVVITYDIAADYLKEAKENAESGDIEGMRSALNKVSRVIDSLISGLNLEYEIAGNLFQIYLQIKRTLVSVSVSADKDEITRIERLISMLRKSFYSIKDEDTSGPLMKNTEQVYQGLTYSNSGYGNESSNVQANRGYIV